MSIAVENFIKAIYQSDKSHADDTKPGNIAKKLNITNAAATDMAKKLADRDLLEYEKYKALRLTEIGNKWAINIIRKHRLWESLLYRLFDMSLHEIHRESELLEHATSDFLAEKIHAYLGYPKFDPHGEPIPNNEGHYPAQVKSVVLTQSLPNQHYTIVKLVSSNEEFFEFCTDNQLVSGAEIFIEKKYESTGMIKLIANHQTLLLNKNFTDLIYITEK